MMLNFKYGFLSMLLATSIVQAAPKKTGKTKAAKPAAAAAPAAAAPAAEPEAAAHAPAMAHGHDDNSLGVAGCGLGSIVVKDKGKWSQVGAAVLNFFGGQSLAVTSGTSNCVAPGAEVAATQRANYVAANLASLSKEAVQGSGDYLNGLAEVMGCRGEAERVRLGTLSQEQYDTIFASGTPDLVLDHYIAAIQADPLLSQQCSAAS